MNKLSRFDLGMIIAFVIVAILGGAAWYYLSGQLQTAQSDAASAASDFDTYTKKEVYLPTAANVKTLQNNIDVMTAQLDPIVKNKLQSDKSGLAKLSGVSTVDWKHNLDDEVGRLNAAAATHGIIVPKNFYYGFSRYLNANPTEEATPVLERQELAIGEVANILINAPAHAIIAVRRTYEEDPADAEQPRNASANASPDQLSGRSIEAPGGVYTAYPFEFEFDVKNTDAFRKIVNDLTASNYVFVVRSILVQNSRLESPKIADLATMAGITDSGTSLINSSPGEVAATQPTVGLKYLFGDETIHVRARIDLIDWHGISHSEAAAAPGAGRGNRVRNRNQPPAGANGV